MAAVVAYQVEYGQKSVFNHHRYGLCNSAL